MVQENDRLSLTRSMEEVSSVDMSYYGRRGRDAAGIGPGHRNRMTFAALDQLGLPENSVMVAMYQK